MFACNFISLRFPVMLLSTPGISSCQAAYCLSESLIMIYHYVYHKGFGRLHRYSAQSLSVSDVFLFVSSKMYDKRDDFDFDIVNFPFLDGDVPRRASYGVYISQLIRFARVCNHVTDFNARNKCFTAKLLQQGYRYHKLRKKPF